MTYWPRFAPFVAALVLTGAAAGRATAQDRPVAGFSREVFGSFGYEHAIINPDAPDVDFLDVGGGFRMRRHSPLALEVAVSHAIAGGEPQPVGFAVGYRVVTATTLASANLSYFFFGQSGDRKVAPFLGGGFGVVVRHDRTNLTVVGGRPQIEPQPHHDTRWNTALNAAAGVRIVAAKKVSITPEVRMYLTGAPFTPIRTSVTAGYTW
jgi:hypothetical protein